MQECGEENDWILAKKGIKLLLNNKIEEAEGLFSTHQDNIQMAAGYCFVTFMNALMSFEEEKLQISLQALRDMEKRCANDIGWLKVMKNKVFGSSNSNRNAAEHLEQQIILADSQVCVALLTFLQQDLSGYVKGGWVLRKAWKVYQHTYSQILHLYRTTCNSTEDVPGSQFPSWKVILKQPSNPNLLSPSDWSVPSNGCSSAASPTTPTSPLSGGINGLRSPLSIFASFGFQAQPSNDIPPNIVSRLMAAVSFGYGIFQLCISLLPPSLLRLIHFLGFEGDRQVGISALMFARQGQDMRAPLATAHAFFPFPIAMYEGSREYIILHFQHAEEDFFITILICPHLAMALLNILSLALLWYHTIVRPFFALDGSNVRAGVEAAQKLIEESQEEYGSSALFLFFKGRVERLKSNVSGALEAYEAAVQASAQREVQLLCLHEVGWCHLIHLSWQPAHVSFLRLRQESRWSKSFYAYLASICAGASGNLDEALTLAHEVPNLATQQRSTQLETFILRRVQRFPHPKSSEEYEDEQTVSLDRHQCTLLAFELLFLWNALPSCSPEGLNYILQECDESSREPMQGLSQLLKGATWCCQRRPEEAAVCFRTCLVQRGALPGRSNGNEDEEENNVEEPQEDRHISAFALYELGTLLSKHSETLEEGKCLLLQAQNNYSGYDFENRLNVRIHAALRNIG